MYTVVKADLKKNLFTSSECFSLLKADHLFDAMMSNGLDDFCAVFITNEDGEILRTNLEYDSTEDYEEDYDLEMGFNPYMGCYTDDC